MVRKLELGEDLPLEIMSKVGQFRLDPKHTWVHENGHGVDMALVGAEVLGTLWFLRIVSISDTVSAKMMVLLRQAMQDGKNEGLMGYVTMFEADRPAEYKLARIAARGKANFKEWNGLIAGGRFENFPGVK